MGGGPLYFVLSLTAFIVGFLPGLLATWLSMRGELPRTDWWQLLKVVGIARGATALLAGIVVPLAVAVAGLVASYFWSNGKGYAGYVAPALLGGWVMAVEPRWLGSLALASGWTCYFATLAFALPLERGLVRRMNARFATRELAEAAARGIRAAYAVQALVVIVILWEVHWH
ncbi:MAG TPA: hypothetical protein VLJ38_09730 [Polyangiaceae bacterium]|nr:hypothetical protein [Polyangiaceae bacterium]